MANFFNNLTYSVTNAGVTTGITAGFTYALGLVNEKDKRAVRLYYDKDRYGGKIENYLLRSIGMSAYSYARKYAMDQLKSLFFGGKETGFNGTSSMTALIQEGTKTEYADGDNKKYKKYGVMPVNNGDYAVVAVDSHGHWCPNAVMLAIPLKQPIAVSQNHIDNGAYGQKRNDAKHGKIDNIIPDCDHLVWFDCSALITVQSQKRLVVTPVTGRDYSRKELISNGDIEFSITGRINSNLPEVYPTNEVQKFIQIMQYKGLVKINSQFLRQFNIEKVIIKDYSMPQKEGFKSIQEYTINCIGVMPSSDIKVKQDTITAIDTIMDDASKQSDNRWQSMLKNAMNGTVKGSMNISESLMDQGFMSIL